MTKSERMRKAKSLRTMAGRMFMMMTDPKWQDYRDEAKAAHDAIFDVVRALEDD